MRLIDEKNIETILRDGENDHVEFKVGYNPTDERVVAAFSNTEGGSIIFGYNESDKKVIGIDEAFKNKIRKGLSHYLDICDIYTVLCQEKQLLVVEVLQSKKPIVIDGKFYFRDGAINKSFYPQEAEKISKVILNSYRSLTLSEISNQVEIGRNEVKRILESPLFSKISAKKIGTAMQYASEEIKINEVKDIASLSEVQNTGDLIAYLENRAKRIGGKTMLHQYTTIRAVQAIITSGEFYIGSPVNMNDKLEYENFCENQWMNLFFTCFMETDDESIAMWSQYAQPWSQGVRLSIPAGKLKEWMKSVSVIYPADITTKKKKGNLKIETMKYKKSLHMVAYTNEDDLKRRKGTEEVSVGEASTQNIKGLYSDKSMCGYVKNAAWGYEKELRFRFDIDKTLCNGENAVKGIVVPIPDDVLRSIEITKGPRLEVTEEWRSLIAIMKKKGLKEPVESIFEGKLQNMACDRCEPNQYYLQSTIVEASDKG